MCIFSQITKPEVYVSGLAAFAAKRILHSQKWNGLSHFKAQTYQNREEMIFRYQQPLPQSVSCWCMYNFHELFYLRTRYDLEYVQLFGFPFDRSLQITTVANNSQEK